MNDELYILKSDFRAYNANYRLYQAAKQSYEKIVYEMQGLKGVSWDKIGRRESLDESSKVVAMLEAKDRAEHEMMKYWIRLDAVLTCLNAVPTEDREMLMEYFIDGRSTAEMAEKHGCTAKQFERKVNAAIAFGMRNGNNKG